jgi:MFS transporter, BCD family, chlorophyll transporter
MLSWLSIVRLGLVQSCLGAIVVLSTSTFNRLMVVELALPAVLPGFLVALHYGIQISRPYWGSRSDNGGARTRWILVGMAALAMGGLGAAIGVVLLESFFAVGLFVSVVSYALIGLGVGASGTSLLALLATATHPDRRAAAATITWLMMIAGIAITATVAGGFLDPYSPLRLLEVVACVTGGALGVTFLAVVGIERSVAQVLADSPAKAAPLPFRQALHVVWQEADARIFTIFVFVSMTAYFMQELILEPYAGLVFGFTPGASTSLSGAQNGGVFAGMLAVGVLASGFRLGSLRGWVIAGCLGSALVLWVLAALGQTGASAGSVMLAVVALGVFNGMFAVAAIGLMMALAGAGRVAREGTRMGLWGASQAIAAGFGGFAGALGVDLFRMFTDDASAFGVVFVLEGCLFFASAAMALTLIGGRASAQQSVVLAGE